MTAMHEEDDRLKAARGLFAAIEGGDAAALLAFMLRMRFKWSTLTG